MLSWSRRHRLLAAVSLVVIAAVPGIAIAAMGDGGGGSPPAAQPAVPSTSPATSSSVVSSTAPTTTKPPPSRAPTTAAPAVAGAATDAAIKGGIVQVEGGGYHTCLRVRRGAVYCWDQGAYGQLGTGTHFRGTPTRTLVLDDAVEIQAGGRFTCPRRSSGQVACWGEDDHAQLGRRDTEPCGDAEIDSVCAPTPQPVKGLSGVQGLATGESHACALLSAGTVSCWGSNELGQLGGSATGDRAAPSPVAGVRGARQVV